ncbi:MAG: hypothetical protein PHH00_03970 [Candidatus Nanoarchaeia archaeon]|nr:hypothetical protein [Candidatus Nanoarchaeia archaeon]
MEEKILQLFTRSHKLKFSDIEKSLSIRSNKLNYHLQNLIKKGIINKTDSKYHLTETSENLIPYLSAKKSPLPIILIHLGTNRSAFLYQRAKRPYKDFLSLPGGRMLLGESLQESVKRIMKEKCNMNAKLSKIHSLSIEHIKKSNKIIHSFILFFVSAKPLSKITLTDLKKSKRKIIKSDYLLLKNDLKKEIRVSSIISSIKD